MQKKDLHCISEFLKQPNQRMSSITDIEKTADLIESELHQLLEKLNDGKIKNIESFQNRLDKTLKRQQKLKNQLQRQSQKIEKLTKENQRLVRENETIVSDNYLLEYKKKDLLVLADELEEAYEEIASKSKEIQEQADMLEEQKGALQDQADYLHEANERITSMHMELQNQRDQILQKNQELVSLNNEKNNLIGIVAHDLKSPLNQIGGLITLIKMTTELDEESMQYIDTMSDSINRLNAMIAKILDIEAIESKKLNLNIEKVDLGNILETIVRNYTYTAKDKNIELVADIQEEEAFANVDKSFLNQIYENLISNAIKFSPNDKKIYVSLSELQDKWRCEIRDEGPGISDEDQKKLFGKFQKLSARPTGNETSTGLGLSIVKKYVDAMNGEIWCESRLGYGASFMVEFSKAD